jgi:hypothetical protein
MKPRLICSFVLLIVAVPVSAGVHKEMYKYPCANVWAAVKDTLRNSGKYGILSINNEEMVASYKISGNFMVNPRTNSVMLNSKGDQCEMQLQSESSGLPTDDQGKFKKRVDESMTKLGYAAKDSAAPSSAPAK